MSSFISKIVWALLFSGMFSLAQAQNLGIGTAAPAQKLDVEGWVEIGDESTGTVGTAGAIRYNSGGFMEYHDGTAWQQLGGGWQLLGNGGTTPAANYLGTSDAQALSVRTNATEAVYINTDQNVGIGTQVNDSPLHIVGTPAGSVTGGGGSPSTQTFNVTIVSTVNGVTTVTSNLTGLPTNITSAELIQVNFAGDGSFAGTEFVDLAIDGTPVGTGFTDNSDDCTFDPVTSGTPLPIDVTALFQGNTNVNLEMTTGSGVNVGVTCPGTSVEVEFVFEVTSGGGGGGSSITGSQAVLHLESDAITGGGGGPTNTVLTETLTIAPTGGDATVNLTGLPPNITNATMDITVAGDLNAVTFEFLTLTIDGSPAGPAQIADGNQDCVHNPATGGTGIDVTALLQGNTAVTLFADAEPGVNDLGCAFGAAEMILTFTITSNAGSTEGPPVIRIQDGNEQAGRVLVSDANGYGYWADPPTPGGGAADTDWDIGTGVVTNTTDNVGIGTGTPAHRLDIAGGEIRVEEGNGIGAIYTGTTGRYQQTNGFDFPGGEGFTFESHFIESGGIHVNGDVTSIWSPGDNELVRFYDEDGMVQRSFIDGISGAYNATSDRRFKENITPIGDVLPRLMQLQGYRYQYIMHPDEIKKGQTSPYYLGVLAQEVQEVFPEIITELDGRLFVSHSEFVPIFIEAFKEQEDQIEHLETRLARLRALAAEREQH